MWFPTLSNSRLEPCSLRAGDYSSGILGRGCWLVPFRVPREAVGYFCDDDLLSSLLAVY
jgi:hypothetical protein